MSVFPTGDKYEGEYDSDQRVGTGFLTKSSGLVLELEWLNPTTCKITYPSGDSFEVFFILVGVVVYVFWTLCRVVC